jgi:hypothetical protein
MQIMTVPMAGRAARRSSAPLTFPVGIVVLDSVWSTATPNRAGDTGGQKTTRPPSSGGRVKVQES